MVRKLRAEGGVKDIAVIEVAQVIGVRTRRRARADEAMAAAANSTLPKRRTRTLNSDELRNISSCIQLRNRIVNTGNIETAASENNNNRWSSSSDGLELFDHDHLVSTSCCSSSRHGSSERIEFADLKDESAADVEIETSTYCGCGERRETTASIELESELEAEEGEESDDVPSDDANSRRRSTVEKMPTESEIEDFFTEAEAKLINQFSEKYNFDFVKEKPREGRYEWIRLR